MSIARRQVLGLAAGWPLLGTGLPAAAQVPRRIARSAPGFTHTLLHDFSAQDGRRPPRRPYYGVQLAGDGLLYGLNGAWDDPGTAFRLATTPGGVDVLHRFGVKPFDGTWPNGRLLEGPDGHFHGVCGSGGRFGKGLLFRMHPNGHVRAVHDFAGAPEDGSSPEGGPMLAADGCLYGTTAGGGSSHARLGLGLGTIYRVQPTGEYELLHSFRGGRHGDGSSPYSPLVQTPDGWLHGVTREGGVNDCGTVFRIAGDGRYEVLHHFAKDSLGRSPHVPLTVTRDGQVYGVTSQAGGKGEGAIFRLVDGGGLERVHAIDFERDGALVLGALAEGADGLLYFCTYFSGSNDSGMVTRLDRSTGRTSVVHAFDRDVEGSGPTGALAAGPDGSLYGTTYYSPDSNGAGLGTVYRLTPA
ncbi:choice-of-anchor tandem repeat GloVer-containing protein [Ideonella sp. YS5]|uniref:choice-of-anchor tandem repeat GloVer-containing protein n=1 Tax=Ideonella sp. YS5 TaxID=3453714 RepID=UPI003EEF140C